jgi:hypothetical protein
MRSDRFDTRQSILRVHILYRENHGALSIRHGGG